jgi:formate hydrogenlyase subunit 6/NADH:ubiquinone oxidoreductase subunit I
LLDTYFINRPNLDRLSRSLFKTYRVYAPFRSGDNRYYKRISAEGLQDAVLSEIRAVQSIKSFYLPARARIAGYFSEAISQKRTRPLAVVGAKSCDLASLKVMDYVFKQDPFKDPIYISERDEGLIISADCTSHGESCFCVSLGIMPYPTEDFDINLSEIESGYVVDVGSVKGEKIIRDYFKLFQKAELYIERKKKNRDRLKERLLAHVRDKRIPAKESIQSLFKKKFDSGLWEEVAKQCVECGACNVICPACHCFILKDQAGDRGFERLRLWDSCLLLSFAMVAGGANPRKLLAERLRNRFNKKFNFFPDAIGRFGCTGCGRCSDACAGKIHIDEVLSRLQGK